MGDVSVCVFGQLSVVKRASKIRLICANDRVRCAGPCFCSRFIGSRM